MSDNKKRHKWIKYPDGHSTCEDCPMQRFTVNGKTQYLSAKSHPEKSTWQEKAGECKEKKA